MAQSNQGPVRLRRVSRARDGRRPMPGRCGSGAPVEHDFVGRAGGGAPTVGGQFDAFAGGEFQPARCVAQARAEDVVHRTANPDSPGLGAPSRKRHRDVSVQGEAPPVFARAPSQIGHGDCLGQDRRGEGTARPATGGGARWRRGVGGCRLHRGRGPAGWWWWCLARSARGRCSGRPAGGFRVGEPEIRCRPRCRGWAARRGRRASARSAPCTGRPGCTGRGEGRPGARFGRPAPRRPSPGT